MREAAKAVLEKVGESAGPLVRAARKRGVDFLEIRARERATTAAVVQDGKVDRLYSPRDRGIAVRALARGRWGFCSASDVSPAGVRVAVAAACDTALALPAGKPFFVPPPPLTDYRVSASVPARRDPREVPLAEKVRLVKRLEAAARSVPKIVNSTAGYSDEATDQLVVNSWGLECRTLMVRTRIRTFAVAAGAGERQRAWETRSFQGGFETVEGLGPGELSVRAARRAASLLRAKPCPAGVFDIVIDPLVTGLLAHEAFGHNCEADLVLSGESILEGKEHSRVASPLVSIADDATMPGRHGSYGYDDEGVPAQRKMLVSRGILNGFMHGLETASRTGGLSTGNCRAQDQASVPIVRMSNTFILPGADEFKGMVSRIRNGLYLRGGDWGYVFVEKGQFTCNCEEGWRIRGGRLAEHLRNVSFSGMTLETLGKVEAVSREFALGLGGMCGKSGQGMPVDAGGPYLAVRRVVVGGQR